MQKFLMPLLAALILASGCVQEQIQTTSTSGSTIASTSTTLPAPEPAITTISTSTTSTTSTTIHTTTTVQKTEECALIDHPSPSDCARGFCPTGKKCHYMAGSMYKPAVCKCF